MDAIDLQNQSGHRAGSDRGRNKMSRHSKKSTKVLKDWLSAHAAHPYPTDEEKALLAAVTGMKMRQISYWFVNARRRQTLGSGQILDSASGSGVAVTITEPALNAPWDKLTPFDRWRHSPPEEESVSWDAISQSLKQTPRSFASDPDFTRVAAPRSIDFPDSSTSSLSSGSMSSAFSYGSESQLGPSNCNSRTKRRRRRRNLPSPRNQLSAGAPKGESRVFQCTFCTDTFRTRYDWTRHEGTVHLVLEKWTCLPFGPRYCDSSSGTVHCGLCEVTNPTDEHLEQHSCTSCTSKPPSQRSFYRKDHLRQHLRLVHNVNDILPSMLRWKSKVSRVKSRCGFCGDTFALWAERNDHLADHFRSGAQMKDWKGCRGLEPAVALLVQNAIPPYLIGIESNDFEPFSGSRAALQAAEGGRALPTQFESLTARLGEFVGKARREGAMITDETLRREARLFLYGDDDPLNHTPADNPAWLQLFKQGYGLASVCSVNGHHLPGANGMSNPAVTAPPFTLEKMQQAAMSDSTAIPLDLLSSFPNDQLGETLAIPWSWQTPECLAEFSEMCQVQAPDCSVANSQVDPGALRHSELPSTFMPPEFMDELIERPTNEPNEAVLPTSLSSGPLDELSISMLFHDECAGA